MPETNPPPPSRTAANSDRELVFNRLFDAPRELVWAAHTEPQHVLQWWGSQGFTNTIHEMDVRPGGLWRLTMHGPDGTDYPNRIEFIEVVPPERLVYHHGDDRNPRMFHVTTTFLAEGDRTRLITRMLFPTAAACAETKRFADDGHRSTMDRLDAHLAGMHADPREIVSARTFAAPRERVFAAFRDPAQQVQWWGPSGFTNTLHEFDLRVGGRWRLTMHGPGGADYLNEKVFTAVTVPERIVFDHLAPIHAFRMTMIYAAPTPATTTLTWRMRFESAAEAAKLRDFISGANEQNFDRLAAHLARVD